MHPLAETACEKLSENQPFVLAAIISRHGSTPRSAGTQMIIAADGSGTGSVGGGFLEARVMAIAQTVLESGRPQIFSADLTPGQAADMDMICGGGVEVLIQRIDPEPEAIGVFQRWRQTLSAGGMCFFLVAITGPDANLLKAGCGLMTADGRLYGLSGASLPKVEDIAAAGRTGLMQRLPVENGDLIVIPNQTSQNLFVFGAGHLAQPVARMAAMIGFRVTVLDDRAAFANTGRFPDAHRVVVLNSFDQAFDDIVVNADSYVVITTRGHLYDRTVLAQTLETPARYIGMIGSRSKRDAIYKALEEQGFRPDDIGRVHSPIGLSIGAQTPEEIAVSIVAELVGFRAGYIR